MCFAFIFIFFIRVFVLVRGEKVGNEGERHEYGGCRYGDIGSRGILYVVGYIAEIGDGKHGFTDYVLIVQGATVGCVVGVALGEVAEGVGVVFVHEDLDDTVGGHGVFIEHKGYGVADLQLLVVHFLDVYERTYVVGGLHGSRKNREDLQTDYSYAHEQYSQCNYNNDDKRAYRVPYFFK